MNLLDSELLKEANLKTVIERYNFFELKCRNCMKKGLMKERDCDLLYGYKKPCCNLMDKFVEKENKEINKKILDKGLQLLFYDLHLK